MNGTTTKLRLTFAQWWQIHERQIRDGATGAAMVVALLLIHSLLRPAQPAPVAPVVVREAQRPIILLQTTTPAPTATPWPTAEPVVIEVPGPTPEPVYVEVPVYVASEPVQEAPAPADLPTMPPQMMVLYDRQQWPSRRSSRDDKCERAAVLCSPVPATKASTASEKPPAATQTWTAESVPSL